MSSVARPTLAIGLKMELVQPSFLTGMYPGVLGFVDNVEIWVQVSVAAS